jgi:predicted permease
VSIMSSDGVRIQEISDTLGHKSRHVTVTVYRHMIVPSIGGGATVMDEVSTMTKTTVMRATKMPRTLRHLTIEQRFEKLTG